ncbi:unnamed protein product [Hymenolepis diminuta]|uniref:Secreted RxLR effector peptide protein n=1 Tax=Hymenolepis diminuta TaxID=6216 RepID=A0A0R3SEA5_HYMDI|nr:unnamed protein product [Hymenolepis diminuta]VUZ45736.1 unnamed protein product [Hymenolepis diminuta]VUZ45742.1 unnamed protein product [Hymenolepis diminuta]
MLFIYLALVTPTTVEGSHQAAATVVNGGGATGTTTAVVPQPMTAAAIQAQPAPHPAAPPPRAPSPLFVSVPPRTSRVLHSEIYQKYIERLRRNSPYLSDWKRQLTGAAEPPPQMSQQQAVQLATNYFDTPQLHSHQGSLVDALWSLRDNLIKDTLNIRTRALGLDEL